MWWIWSHITTDFQHLLGQLQLNYTHIHTHTHMHTQTHIFRIQFMQSSAMTSPLTGVLAVFLSLCLYLSLPLTLTHVRVPSSVKKICSLNGRQRTQNILTFSINNIMLFWSHASSECRWVNSIFLLFISFFRKQSSGAIHKTIDFWKQLSRLSGIYNCG